MSSYVISEFSTMFPLQPAHAEVPAVDACSGFSLISNVGSAHHTQKSIRDNECWLVIGWCKKLTRGQRVDQSHEPYISWCFTPKTP